MRSATLPIFLIIVFLLAGFTGWQFLQQHRSIPNEGPPVIHFKNTDVRVEFARTDEEKIQGLSGRAALKDNIGMLFINARDDYHAIWMKDMRFPIDIIWLSADGRIVDSKADATPESYPDIFRPQNPARFVLEVPAGFAALYHVNIDDSVKLPAGLY